MTDEQREMREYLAELTRRVDQGEIAGLAIAAITPQRMVQTIVLGQCARHPIQTLGMARLLSRTVEDGILARPVPPSAEETHPKTRKP